MKTVTLAVALAVAAASLPAGAQNPPPGTLVRPADAPAGTVVVPDRFLRRWDPVTVFFDHDEGPGVGVPEDNPGRWVRFSPSHPGAFTWIDRRTLQFRPADPWPALTRFTWELDGHAVTLATLMDAPQAVNPANGARGLADVQAITLTFPQPVETAALARMTRLELRPLPGVGSSGARWLDAADFDVTAQERSGPEAPAGYRISLHAPVPAGTLGVLHLRLSLDDDVDRSFYTSTFATEEPFRVVALGSSSNRYPVAPGGSRYGREQALDAGTGRRTVVVELSAAPQAVDAVLGRNLVRFEPPVEKLEYHAVGRTIEVSGSFRRDTLYHVRVAGKGLADSQGRSLQMGGPSELWLYFSSLPRYLKWRASQGMVERFGPKMVPVEGRGEDRFDLRIYPVNPRDLSFWPFPSQPVVLDDNRRPPGPGETPAAADGTRRVSPAALYQQLAALGSPAVSELVQAPPHAAEAASFGLDLAPYLARISGADAPGHYLVGLRPLGAGSQRQWMRVQVTDLSLTTVEEPHAVRFVVTSLSTGNPVAGATVKVEAQGKKWGDKKPRLEGTTGPDGAVRWEPQPCKSCSLMRIVVSKGSDVLVLDPYQPPSRYADNDWSSGGDWLAWTSVPHTHRGPQAEVVSHLFTDRPVYRPDQEVFIKGYVRRRQHGRLEIVPLTKAVIVVEGPGDFEWRLPVKATELGSVAATFAETDLPTGEYEAWLEANVAGQTDWSSDTVPFSIEAYRIPRFEVNLHSPDRTGLDAPFDVTLTAAYYAGGRVADRPVAWRVTQFPYAWTPPGRKGFLFSSDGRYSQTPAFEPRAALERADHTDAEGSARITLDPTVEPTASPRSYDIEATVTGADDQTVTATRRVLALPPFVVGVKVPRFLPEATSIKPEVIIAAPDGKAVAGQELSVRLLNRQWHSTLRASDFSDGVARYVTDVVDEEVLHRTVTSTAEPLTLDLPIPRAGVYVVEVSSRDRVGRAQTVAVDLYAGGPQPVAWEKPSTRVFEVKTDRDRYAPGDDAAFVLESPFQDAMALVIVETPDRNRYQWLPVHGGTATWSLKVEDSWAPRLPVHFVLLRGRVPGTKPLPGSSTDLGRPTTMATTRWIKVEPRAQELSVKLDHPERALPGATVDVTVRLADPDGRPLAGEVTLWLVDQAVLALGREQPLDPLHDLITNVLSHLELRDTRELPFGYIPLAQSPGGGGAVAYTTLGSPLERATVRRIFKPVPYYNPRVMVGPEGVTTVKVKLPDNLTVFKLRAKAVSGAQRFGFATGELAVRLPVIVQPGLPRFVRPGDRFTAVAIGRIVEGQGGPGSAEAKVEGLTLQGDARRTVDWTPNTPQRLEFPVEVPTPPLDERGRLARTEVKVRVAVERASDGATDAFESVLPIRDDRHPEVVRTLSEVAPGQPVALPGPTGTVRPGTLMRSVLVSDQPALVEMTSALDVLLGYPFGCTEQRVAKARARIAMRKLRELLHLTDGKDLIQQSVSDTLTWISGTVTPNGLVAYWPGADGNVALTAWSAEMMVEARQAGLRIDDKLLDNLLGTLSRALRSDYSHFIDGESYYERTAALRALAEAGRFDPAYASELARRTAYLNLEAKAQVLSALAKGSGSSPQLAGPLADQVWHGIVTRLQGGREVYAGLQRQDVVRNGLILPSETRTLAEVARALTATKGDDPRVQILVDGLVRLGRGDGWGSTNADAAALLALARIVQPPFAGASPHTVEVSIGDVANTLETGPDAPLAALTSTRTGQARASLRKGGPLSLRAEARWVPAGPGSEEAAGSAGFVVGREQLLIGPGDTPPRRLALDKPAITAGYTVGSIVEERVEVVNPADRHYVVVMVPLAAGMEPLNPALATAPPEARPSGTLTLAPTYAAFLDDSVAYYYDTLPKGTYRFAFRTRATVPGRFVQPAAFAEMMYDRSTRGQGNGAWVEVTAAP